MKSSTNNLYEVLGLTKDCSEDDIKNAFKTLAKKHHPDRGGDDEKFKEINEAYAILSDPQKRQNYDQFGSAEMADMQMPDINDLMENLFGMGGSFPFGNVMGGGIPGMGGGRGNRKKGPSKHFDIEVSLEDVYQGSSVKYKLNKKIFTGNLTSSKCKECKGQGQVVQQINMGFMVTQNISQCSKCSGVGFSFQEKDFKTSTIEIEIPIPKGCIEGNKICMRNQGDEYPNVEPGDLLFTIKYKPHPFYYTVDSEIGELFCNIDISLYEFMFGFTRTLKLLNNEYIKIVLPPNQYLTDTISNQIKKKLPNRGLTFKNHVGDLHLIFNIHLPLLKDSHNKAFHDLLKTSKYNLPIMKDYSNYSMSEIINLNQL